MGFLENTKDSDKIALLLLYTGILLVVMGAYTGVYFILHLEDVARLDRALLAVAAIGSTGVSLITAASIVLRFQSKTPNGKPAEPPKDPKP